MFRLNPDLDAAALAEAFSAKRRLHVPNFLVAEDADRLHQALVDADDWRVVIKQGIDRHEFPATISRQQKDQLSLLARRANPDALQFRFDYVPVPESARERAEKTDLVSQFLDFLCSDEMIGFFRTLTGTPEISFADAQATAYNEGDFLTVHDDHIDSQSRHAAYVLNLSPRWKMDWGGLLMFPSPSGHVEEAYTPMYNTLNIFAVPMRHAVSLVTPFAEGKRLAVNGWLRSGPVPE